MKKYIIGFVVGALTMTAFSASAEVVSLIGKSIDNEYVVQLNGEELGTKAISIEGTSYAPVRAVGEALGLNVDFENEVVILEETQDQAVEVNKSVVPDTSLLEQSIQRNLETIESNNETIRLFQAEIDRLENELLKSSSSEENNRTELMIKNNQMTVDRMKEANVELERRISEARAQLEAKLAQ